MMRPKGPMRLWPVEAQRAYNAALMRYYRGRGPHPGKPRHGSPLFEELVQRLDEVSVGTLHGYQGA